MSDNQVGIIDIGSNTIRLCLYKNTKDILETYYTKKDFFGLQKYIYNNVDPAKAMSKMIHVVLDMNDDCKKFDVKPFIIGTSAIREISKIFDVEDYFFEHTNMKLDILSTEKEGIYSFLGAVNNLQPKKKILLFDLGGGSLEVGEYHKKKLSNICSFPLGALILSMRFFNGTKNLSQSINKCSIYVNSYLDQLKISKGNNGFIGIGGTIRNLGKIKLFNDNSNYDKSRINNMKIHITEIEEIIEKLMISDNSMKDIKALNPNRYKTILPGSIVILELLKKTGLNTINISVNGIREGYLMSH